MTNCEDYITIIRDIEELERLGFKFEVRNGNLNVIPNYIPVDFNLLNSYVGLVKRVDYYDEEAIITAIKYKGELGDDENG